MKPLVAVVGRPNVGKSSFFNKIIGQRISIVEDVPGVTRDRIYGDAEWAGKKFTMIDTGGLDMTSEDVLLTQMRYQAQLAIDTADVILFFCDARQGLTGDDHEVANMLRKTNKPVILVVNKVDHVGLQANVFEFYNLGLGDPIGISAANMFGLGDVLQAITDLLPAQSEEEQDEEKPCSIAVVGKPNVGKSSMVNYLLGQERTMVSNIPGTTRDAIDSPLTDAEGNQYIIIDTAGIRKKSVIEEASLERYSVLRAIAAIDRCDVALLVIDAQEGVTEQDTKIAGLILDAGKGVVVCINKWDAVDKETGTLEKYKLQVLEDLKFMRYTPVIFVSAKSGKRMDHVLKQVQAVWQNCNKRITTGVLNDIMQDAQMAMQPPAIAGRRLKLYYATQQSVAPPTFILFVNEEKLMHFSYLRFLENHIRKSVDFSGTPLRLIIRERKNEDK
ncbi:MAG: ribosome biogenesis GTPase Der [Eubacteriales bacterium]|nr:ribosome biogenesis GTPase Der [Eubacteriales bacterium]